MKVLRWTGKSLEVLRGEGWLVDADFVSRDLTPALAYTLNPWLRRCVDLRAGAIEAMPFAVLRGDSEAPWPLPVPPSVLSALLGLTERALCLHGAAYWLKVQNRRGGLLSLRWLAPQSVRVVASPANGLEGFERTTGIQVTRFLPDELVFFWEDNWSGEIGPGEPVARAALRAARLALAAQEYSVQFFESSGIPPLIISADVLPDERERLETWWSTLRRRARSFWRAVVLSTSVQVTQLSIPAGKDLALQELLEEARRQIAVAFGVPQTLLEDAANFATAREHRRSFYAETVIPRCQMLASVLTEQLFAHYGLEFRFLPERLEIFQQEEAEKAQALVALVQAGVMTPNEAREQLGLPVATPARSDQEQPEEPEEPEEETKGLPPDALADLHRWRRKCQARQRLADFSSERIPDALADAVRAVADLYGYQAAFSFLPRYRALAAKREPDRPYEDELRRRILHVLEDARDAVIAAAGSDNPAAALDALPDALRAAIQPVLAEAVVSEVLAHMALVGLYADVAAVNQAALAWAQQYTYGLVSNLTDTTREVVRHAISQFVSMPGMTVGDLRALLEPAFGPVRAEMIAITEVTRAYAQATLIYQQLLRDFGLEMARVWQTSHDEKVCPVCSPNHNKPEWEWTFPSGPPAHPRCRCWVTLSARRKR